MLNKINVYLQYLYPQHAITMLAGKLANSRSPRLKDFLIDRFIKAHRVDMSTAVNSDPHAYSSFNDFFTRELKPGIRPVVPPPEIASPADGTISECGLIHQQRLFQAKNYYYELPSLLANDRELTPQFVDGSFATIYLAPHNYHRVHMPVPGKLLKTIFVPGDLFSVNKTTTATIPNLFTRNERLICYFDTPAGPMALIMVGAIIVGSIKMVWQQQATRTKTITIEHWAERDIHLQQGAETGLFQLGSTVIILFTKNRVAWDPKITTDISVTYGSSIGSLCDHRGESSMGSPISPRLSNR